MTGTQPVNAARPGASAGPVLDYRKNPFGLVYEDAITENEAGGASIHPVTYMLRGLKIAANIYTPANHDPSERVPAIAVAHPNGGVKEQVAGRYAQRLAEQGYITIAADAAYQGASAGEPRSVDKPFYRTDDIHGMADYIAGYPGVDVDRSRPAGDMRRRWLLLEGGAVGQAVQDARHYQHVQLRPGPPQRLAGLAA